MLIEDYFCCNVEQNSDNQLVLDGLKLIAKERKQQIYVLSAPLTDRKYSYDYSKAMIVLSTKRSVAFVDYQDGENEDFLDYYDDVIEDISSISDRYGYKSKVVLGRPRDWKKELTKTVSICDIQNVEEWFDMNLAIPQCKYRKMDLLLSLFIGSINDVSDITSDEPDNILDKVRHKIQLFDGQQTRFIYEELDADDKRITIQGLSGTGKTELLLHKLKELYVDEPNALFGFTCFNKILSNKLRTRIPEFFNFMRVEQQIDWNKLLCVNAWGRYNNATSGIYRYICDFYGINFFSYKECGSFDAACKAAIKAINELESNPGFAFTYIFIDESQDFKESFFDLCALVTEKKVFIAGDIFQSIFEERKQDAVEPNFLLSNCYRTDPKTLMFAQAIGMGLFEEQKLWWLDDKEWELCGYKILESGKKYRFTREPLRRFEDIDPKFNSLMIVRTSSLYVDMVKELKKLKTEFPTVTPGDIAIIFLDNQSYIYDYTQNLERVIMGELGWECNIAYETKSDDKERILISNRNNVKGLEYPFVFCITSKITKEPSYRNTIYTMLTRSFIRSYLILPKSSEAGLTAEMLRGGNQIMTEGYMEVVAPSPSEVNQIKAWVRSSKKALSLDERIDLIFHEMGLDNPDMKKICLETIEKTSTHPNDEQLRKLIDSISSMYEK